LLYDQTEQGRTLRILTLIDEHTKECLTIHAGYSIRAVDAITVLEAAIQRYGRLSTCAATMDQSSLPKRFGLAGDPTRQKRLYPTRSTLGTGLYRKLP